MTTTTLNPGVAGTDGVVPVYEPDARWTQWALNQVYNGGPGANRYVPKVDDYVVDTDTDERYKVVAIDITTYLPTMVKIKPLIDGGDITSTDLLLGVGPGTQADTYRIYLDKSVIPHTLSVDARLRVNGTMCSYCQIVRGNKADATAKVISAFYDQTGTLLGQNVYLELVAMSDLKNIAVKSVPVCYTTEDMPDGEVVTAYFYSDDGGVVSKRQLIVENTACIRTTDASQKYVTSISLDTPFLSASNPQLIQYPLNVPLRGLNLFGLVHYSDGSSLRIPVDGTKFALFGLEQYVATVIGQRLPLVLRYNLSPGEIVYGATTADGKFLTETFVAETVKADGAYSVKLFGYPVWIDAVNGYRMEWFLFNLDRKVWYRATNYVKFNENSPKFNPIAYGQLQRMSVSVNLKDVNGIYKDYVHTQTIDISLMRQGSDHTGTNWTVGFDPSQNPPFGQNNYAPLTFINQNLKTIRIDQGETDTSVWLNRMYRLTKPLADPAKEVQAPDPNFFSLVFSDGTELEFPLSQWNTDLTINKLLNDSDTLFVRFFFRTPETDLQLGITGIPIYQVN